MNIYLDILFIENLLMNYIILFGTGFIQKLKMKNYRLVISSLMGAIYSIIIYLKIIPIYSNVFMKILLSLIMIYIAFNPQSIKKMLKTLLLFYLISFVTGGCALALLYLISPKSISFSNGVLTGSYPMKVTLIAGAVGFLIIQYSFRLNKMKLRKQDLICNITVKVCGKLLQTKAFLDSGNNLKDPITRTPVVIIEKVKVEKIINIKELEGGENDIKLRFIPFKAIGKQNGLLMGIKADYIEIEYDDEKTLVNNVILGLYENQISQNYSALVGLNIINGGNENEFSSNTKKNILQFSKRW